MLLTCENSNIGPSAVYIYYRIWEQINVNWYYSNINLIHINKLEHFFFVSWHWLFQSMYCLQLSKLAHHHVNFAYWRIYLHQKCFHALTPPIFHRFVWSMEWKIIRIVLKFNIWIGKIFCSNVFPMKF